MQRCHNCLNDSIALANSDVEDNSKKWTYKCSKCKARYELWEFLD